MDDLNRGVIRFVHLTSVETKKRREEYACKVKDGYVMPRERKKRKDVGTKCPRKGTEVIRRASSVENPSNEAASSAPITANSQYSVMSDAGNSINQPDQTQLCPPTTNGFESFSTNAWL